jgi:hypothetical protein
MLLELRRISEFVSCFATFAAFALKLGLSFCSKELHAVPVHFSV